MTDQTLDHQHVLETTLRMQNEAIRASDAKITLLVPTTTAMLGLLVTQFTRSDAGIVTTVAVLMSLAPLIVVYSFLSATVIPRFRSSRPSLLFFGDIARMAPDSYGAAVVAMDRDAYLADLARQCEVTATIALSKYRHLRYAYMAFFVAVPFWSVATYLLNR